MVDFMYCLTNLLFFDTPLWYYNSSFCCLFSGDIYLSFGISIWLLASSFCECNSVDCNSPEDIFEKFVILSPILLPIKSPVASAVFWIALFEAVFIGSVVDFLAVSKIFDYAYSLNFYLCF